MATATGIEYESLRDVPTKYLICKTFGHAWEEFIPVGKRKPSFGFRFSLLCVTCESERHDLLNQKGELLERAYGRPDEWPIHFAWNRDECREALNGRKRRRARRGTQMVAV